MTCLHTRSDFDVVLSSCVMPEKPACRKHPVREHKVQVRLGEQESSDESPKANFVFVLDVLVDLGFCFGKFNERMRVLPLLRGTFRLNVCETVGRDVAMDGGPVKWQRADPKCEPRCGAIGKRFELFQLHDRRRRSQSLQRGRIVMKLAHCFDRSADLKAEIKNRHRG